MRGSRAERWGGACGKEGAASQHRAGRTSGAAPWARLGGRRRERRAPARAPAVPPPPPLVASATPAPAPRVRLRCAARAGSADLGGVRLESKTCLFAKGQYCSNISEVPMAAAAAGGGCRDAGAQESWTAAGVDHRRCRGAGGAGGEAGRAGGWLPGARRAALRARSRGAVGCAGRVADGEGGQRCRSRSWAAVTDRCPCAIARDASMVLTGLSCRACFACARRQSLVGVRAPGKGANAGAGLHSGT
jgi:hypothetical protein